MEPVLCVSAFASDRMSSSGSEPLAGPRRPRAHPLDVHLLADPGASLLLQHTLDQLLRWLCPSLRIFHVSERASPFRGPAHTGPVAGHPSLAITFFLHEAYGAERILRVLDYFQRPPWRFHHTESSSCSSSSSSSGCSSSSSSSAGLLRPYLLPSRDFYSLGPGMPVWAVRPVHCGGEVLRLTLYSWQQHYEDAVRFYQTVLRRRAEEQKTGFCWFTLHREPGLCLQLALKRLPPGVRARPCHSAVLQFGVEEMGQLVPLLPKPCSPISSTRWQTEDLDGNKVLFQVKPPAGPERPLTCAFPLACPSATPAPAQQGRGFSPGSLWGRGVQGPHVEPLLEFQGGAASLESGSCSSIPSGSSCCSSPNGSPGPFSGPAGANPPFRPSVSRSLSHLLLEEDQEETNVDTGVPASLGTAARSASVELLLAPSSQSPAAGAEAPLTGGPAPAHPGGARKGPARPESRSVAELLSARKHRHQPEDEFFI